MSIFRWRSLKTRVTLFTLAIFLVSLWSLAAYASRELREDMQRLLGEQQFSTASFVAAEINTELEERFAALDIVARGVGPAMLGDAAAMQTFLEQRLILKQRFNSGALAARRDGAAIAEVPPSAGRIGINYFDSDAVGTVLKEGKPVIGRPVIGSKLQAPIFTMAVPIRDAHDNVIGALAGVTNLGLPSFLDKISENRYGQTGGYIIVAPQYRLIVTATDRRRTMEVLPPAGTNPWIDRVIQGHEGTNVFVNSLGVEVLSSVKRVPIAGWMLVVASPTAEVFAPISALQQRMRLATIVLTLLVGGLTSWMLRSQLAPMLAAAKTLGNLSDGTQPLLPLPITRQDEIGDLIGGFNHVLGTLGRREAALQESEEKFRTIFEEAPLGIALIDSLTGSIGEVNPKFAEIAGRMRAEISNADWKNITHVDNVQEDLGHMALMNAGKIPGISSTKRYVRPDGSAIWIDMAIAPLSAEDTRHPRHVAMIEDITRRKEAEEALRELLLEKEALLKEVHHRVKNNLQVVNSLLRLEAGRSAHPDTQSVLGDIQGRIRSMALLHESLYRSGTFAAVNLGTYLEQVTTQSFRALVDRPGSIRLDLDLAPIHVEMDQAMPCGLLVNELVSNCLKHGFPDGRTGEVRVELRPVDDGPQVRLRVSDTGVGLPDDFQSKRGYSLGMQLVSDLVRQLRGTLEIGLGSAAVFTVTFVVVKPKAAAAAVAKVM